jgi:hypothetical protein
MEKNRIFNLLKPVQPPPTFWDKTYDWILGKARVVILITELLIVFAFVAKVIVDTQARTKDEEIASLKAELGFYSTQREPLFRDIQKRDSAYQRLWSISNSYTDIFKEIYSYMQNPSAELTVSADKNRVSILGYDDLSSVQNLETQLKASATFSSVFVETLSLEQKEILQSTGQYVLVATIANYQRGLLE